MLGILCSSFLTFEAGDVCLERWAFPAKAKFGREDSV